MNAIQQIEARYARQDAPDFRPGDLVRVHVRIREGEKERIQVFEGNVIKMSSAGPRRTFTVRKISYGIGVERVFPISSPKIAKIELAGYGRVRRSKLYYIRSRRGKAARIRTKKSRRGNV